MFELRNRKLNRLKDYDYSQGGLYFVTICVKNKEEYFGKVENGEMILSDTGEIVEKCWLDIPDHFLDVELDEFVVMPNHVHGILIIKDDDDMASVGNRHACSLPLPQSQKRQYQKLPIVIGSFKSVVAKNIHIQNDFDYFQWQKSYYDVIIRDEIMLNTKRQYILENPPKWWRDRNNLNNKIID